MKVRGNVRVHSRARFRLSNALRPCRCPIAGSYDDAYASPSACEGVALTRGLVSPETSARDVTGLFLRGGNPEFFSAKVGTLEDELAGQRGRPVFPTVARTAL